MEKLWKSVAIWPKEANVSNNKSWDEHYTEEAARAVCSMLRRDGFGGEGKIFPTNTYVETPEEFKNQELSKVVPLPCPFCGTSYYWYEHMSCWVHNPCREYCRMELDNIGTMIDVIAHNRRAPTRELVEAVERYKNSDQGHAQYAEKNNVVDVAVKICEVGK